MCKDLTKITVAEMLLRAERFMANLNDLGGYDKCRCEGVSVDPKSPEYYSVEFYSTDEFQSNVGAEHRIRHGFQVLLFDISETDPKLPHDWPLREERELHVLAKQNAGLGDIDKEMRSAAAKAFTERMVVERNRLGLMLKDMREHREAEHFGTGEVPY